MHKQHHLSVCLLIYQSVLELFLPKACLNGGGSLLHVGIFTITLCQLPSKLLVAWSIIEGEALKKKSCIFFIDMRASH